MALLAVAVAAAATVIGGCGGSSRAATGGSSDSKRVTHADPITLLPQPGQVSGLIKHATSTNRHDQVLDATTVTSSFGTASPVAMRQASGTAELSVTGPAGAQLYTQVFAFKTLAGARSLAATFLTRTRLSQTDQPGSGSPGEQEEASRQAYGPGDVSYRYAFREQNVLCLVELDGPRGTYTLSDAVAVAKTADRQIASALS